MRRMKIEYLSIFRALAILAVLFIHATSYSMNDAKESSIYYGYVFINTMSKFAVPAFIFLSAFVLFYNYAGRSFTRSTLFSFYRKRLKYIILPYLICSLCYFLVIQWLRQDLTLTWSGLQTFGYQLLTGSAYAHLYYIIVIVQFYLLFPLHVYIARSKLIAKYSILIGLVLQWSFVLLNKYFFHISEKGSLFLSYVSFWMLGAFIALYWDQATSWLQSLFNPQSTPRYKWWNRLLWSSWLLIGLFQVQMWYALNLKIWWVNSLYYELIWNVYSLLSCLILFQVSSWITRSGKRFITNTLIHLGDASFGIYLLHPVFLLIYRKLPWYGGSPILYPIFIIVGFILSLGISWIIVTYVTRWFPWSWIVFGSTADRSAKKEQASKPSSTSINA